MHSMQPKDETHLTISSKPVPDKSLICAFFNGRNTARCSLRVLKASQYTSLLLSQTRSSVCQGRTGGPGSKPKRIRISKRRNTTD